MQRSAGAITVIWAGLAAGLLGGCSMPMADLPLVGVPAGAPARPAEPALYPAVHDMPAKPAAPMLDADEQARVETELKAARARQTGQAKSATE
jgi:hypothetical protein